MYMNTCMYIQMYIYMHIHIVNAHIYVRQHCIKSCLLVLNFEQHKTKAAFTYHMTTFVS